MERDIVKPPLVDMGVRRVSFVKGAGVFFPPQHFPGSVSNSLSEQRQDISHRNTTGACRAKDQCSGAYAGTEGRREGKGENGGREKEREQRKRCEKGRKGGGNVGRWKARKREKTRAQSMCVGEGERPLGGLEGVESVALPQGSVCKPLSTPKAAFTKRFTRQVSGVLCCPAL